jgi:peptidyl-prolyl cis-trans isomerase A (cyclophilin A)
MNQRTRLRGTVLAAIISGSTLLPGLASATVVEFQTVMGNFEVNLYDNGTPQTVANFLSYVNSGAYNDAIVHRSVPGFVVQGGGFFYDPGVPISPITANAPVVNEPEYANVRGTIAMAKLAGDANSATNQWFFNLANNTGDLDGQNGGFTVFGQVVGDGMDVVDAIAALPTYAFAAPFSQIPLTNYTAGATVDDTHLIIISSISVTDATVDSAGAAGLTPAPNTAGTVTPPPVTPPATGGGGGGGGSLGFASLVGLMLCMRRRRTLPLVA